MLEMWRWPVKSMGGEEVRSFRLDERGVGGDRTHAVIHHHKGEWKPLTAREAPRLLTWHASYPFAPDAGLRPDDPPHAQVTGPDGRSWRWGDPRLRAALERERNGGMVLVGRRQLRSNNSWMHNLPALVKGKESCTLQVHPTDAERLGLVDGGSALVSSASGRIVAPVEVTDGIMPGVVSIPHGWGHSAPGSQLSVASEHAGVNSNLLADESFVEPLSGNAVLNGIPVEVVPAALMPRPAGLRSGSRLPSGS